MYKCFECITESNFFKFVSSHHVGVACMNFCRFVGFVSCIIIVIRIVTFAGGSHYNSWSFERTVVYKMAFFSKRFRAWLVGQRLASKPPEVTFSENKCQTLRELTARVMRGLGSEFGFRRFVQVRVAQGWLFNFLVYISRYQQCQPVAF